MGPTAVLNRCGKSRRHSGIRFSDCPALSEFLYRLPYGGPFSIHNINKFDANLLENILPLFTKTNYLMVYMKVYMCTWKSLLFIPRIIRLVSTLGGHNGVISILK